MSHIEQSTAKIRDEEWLEIKYIGKDKRQYTDNREENIYWTYTPSGRICTTLGKINFDDGCVNVLTFVDLVEKITFEIQINYDDDPESEEENIEIHNLYFSAENDLIVIAVFTAEIKQLVYNVDFVNQALELVETISHEIDMRDGEISIASCPNMFVYLKGIEYLVLVGEGEETTIDETTKQFLYSIFLIPKNPVERNAPLTEYQFHLTDRLYANIKEYIHLFLEQNRLTEHAMTIETASCIIQDNKLWFGFSFVADHNFVDDLPAYIPDEEIVRGRLLGGFWEVDLSKMKNVCEKSKTEVGRLLEEQANACKFIIHGSLQMAQKIYYSHFEPDVGLLYICNTNQEDNYDSAVTLLYPCKMSDGRKTITLNCKYPHEDHYQKWNNQFSFHPHGAFLNFRYDENHLEGAPIHIDAIKYFKLNLMSLALNKVLFHKNTPIRNHPAYRLCFNKEKPIDYIDIITRKSLKRKHADD